MKRITFKLVVLAILLGIVVTGGLATQSDWTDKGDCSNPDAPRTSTVQRVFCSGRAYGFPMRFVQSEPTVDVSPLSLNEASPVLLGVSATTKLNVAGLLINVAVWSLLSLGLLTLVRTIFHFRKTDRRSEE